MLKTYILLAVFVVPAVGFAFAQETQIGRAADGKNYLETPTGMTLYVNDKDGSSGGGSSCTAQCVVAWPPFAAPLGASPHDQWTIVKREDGSTQWAFNGRPVYTFQKIRRPDSATAMPLTETHGTLLSPRAFSDPADSVGPSR